MKTNVKQGKSEGNEGKPIGNKEKKGKYRKIKENQWKMKGEPVQKTCAVSLGMCLSLTMAL